MKKITSICCSGLIAAGLLAGCGGPGKDSDKATASAADSTARADTVDVHKDWKIGVQLWTFHYVPFVQAIEKADSAHVKWLEAIPGQPLGGGMKDSFGIDMSEASKARIKKLLDSKGMQIVAVGVIGPGSVAEWKRWFDLAKEFGLSYITCEPLRQHWDAIDSLAGIYGINIAIHDHPKPDPYWTPDSVLAAIAGHHHIGACADVGHWTRNGLDPVDCLKKLEGHIYGVHLKDVDSAGKVDANDKVVGTGVISFAPIFQELKRQGFKGMFSIEREGNWLNNVPDVIATINFYNDQLSKL